MALKTKLHIPSLDGLRGILASWVVASHCLTTSGFDYAQAIPGLESKWESLFMRSLDLIRAGEIPVYVFMILSGFVISLMLSGKPQTYGVFAIRRWFRLWPCMIVSYLAVLAISPFRTESIPVFHSSDAKDQIVREAALSNHYDVEYLISHAAMIHGVIPKQLLPGSSTAVLVPAWSISLEWQFYLIAPLLLISAVP